MGLKAAVFAVALGAILALPAVVTPDDLPAAEARQRELCSLLVRCGLAPPAGACTPASSLGVPGVTYDDERCAEPRELTARGFPATEPLGASVYRFLGRRYRVTYDVAGRVALSPARLEMLLDDLPLAAHLLSHFQKTVYTAAYLDKTRTRLRGSKGNTVTGEITIISGSSQERTTWWLGRGSSKVGPWRIGGRTLVRFGFAPAPGGRGIDYRVRIVGSPDNGFLNTIMTMGIFRGIVAREMREVVTDITEAAQKLDAAPVPLPGAWTAQEQASLLELRRR